MRRYQADEGKYFESRVERPVDSFGIEDVLALRDAAGKRKYMANRLVQYARAWFPWCANDQDGRVLVWPLPSNPEAKVTLCKETERDRVLSAEELNTLEDALATEKNHDLRDFMWLALDSGARKMNVLTMTWDEIDWDGNEWRIPFSKSGEGYTVALPSRSVQTLKRRQELRTTSPFVFPPIRSAYLHLDKPFQRLCKHAGLATWYS